MTDDRVARLLEEIRDLQRQQLANSQRAIENQQDAIAKQQNAITLYRRALRFAVILTAPLVVIVLLLLFWLMRSPLFP